MSTLNARQKKLFIKYIIIAFCLGFFPSVITNNLIAKDIYNQYNLMVSANVGNLKNDVEKRLGEPDIVFKDKKNLKVDGYSTVPENRVMDEVVGYKRGKYLMYVFYKEDKVISTFFPYKAGKKQ